MEKSEFAQQLFDVFENNNDEGEVNVKGLMELQGIFDSVPLEERAEVFMLFQEKLFETYSPHNLDQFVDRGTVH